MNRVLWLTVALASTLQAQAPPELGPPPRPAPAPSDKISLTIKGDVDAEMAPVAGKLAQLFYEGYPKLLARFDNPKKPAPRDITIVFKGKDEMRGVPAYCTGAEISVSIDWLRKNPQDVALITHELTHSVQEYARGTPGWLTEGIADYTRKIYGPKEQPGWSLPARLTAKNSYRDSYRVTGRFLEWLDAKHPGTVDGLHKAAQAREYSPELFKKLAGKNLDELWKDCVEELGAKK